MTQAETKVWKEIMLALTNCRLFRNQRYKGQIVSNGKITGAWADCGVGGDGGSDLIGFVPTVITPDMVGKTVAIFLAIETKVKKGRVAEEQKTFIAGVRSYGGIAGVARSVEDAEKLIYGENVPSD